MPDKATYFFPFLVARRIKQLGAGYLVGQPRSAWALGTGHLDVTFKEDANTTLDKISAQNLNIIRNQHLKVARYPWSKNVPSQKAIQHRHGPSEVSGRDSQALKNTAFLEPVG